MPWHPGGGVPVNEICPDAPGKVLANLCAQRHTSHLTPALTLTTIHTRKCGNAHRVYITWLDRTIPLQPRET